MMDIRTCVYILITYKHMVILLCILPFYCTVYYLYVRIFTYFKNPTFQTLYLHTNHQILNMSSLGGFKNKPGSSLESSVRYLMSLVRTKLILTCGLCQLQVDTSIDVPPSYLIQHNVPSKKTLQIA